MMNHYKEVFKNAVLEDKTPPLQHLKDITAFMFSVADIINKDLTASGADTHIRKHWTAEGDDDMDQVDEVPVDEYEGIASAGLTIYKGPEPDWDAIDWDNEEAIDKQRSQDMKKEVASVFCSIEGEKLSIESFPYEIETLNLGNPPRPVEVNNPGHPQNYKHLDPEMAKAIIINQLKAHLGPNVLTKLTQYYGTQGNDGPSTFDNKL